MCGCSDSNREKVDFESTASAELRHIRKVFETAVSCQLDYASFGAVGEIRTLISMALNHARLAICATTA